MEAEKFMDVLGASFYAGVPDSQLKALCSCLMRRYGIDPAHHLIGANEGNCAALAAGYYLATGRVPVVYMQNSGEGNIINPAASLLHRDVYGIPVIFVIGWRGEPGGHDEPQHVYQGKVTLKLLEDMEIDSFVVSAETTEEELSEVMTRFRRQLDAGRDVAFVIRKGALTDKKGMVFSNSHTLVREDVIREVVQYSGEDPIVSTTGKASRELFEIRESRGEGHGCDFLTVGSMGHASSIALGIAGQMPEKRIWCLDGDGAVLMHMGAMGVIGAAGPANLVHVIINNEAHETVGGMPTVAGKVNLKEVARACGYSLVLEASDMDELREALKAATEGMQLTCILVNCSISSRADLGRPTTTAAENGKAFMEHLKHLT